MAAFWLIAGLGVATLTGVGALILGASVFAALAVYAATGCLTLCIGLMAAAMDDAEDTEFSTDPQIVPAE